MANAAIDLKALGMELKRTAQTERNVSLDMLLKLKTFDDHCGLHVFNCRSLFEFA